MYGKDMVEEAIEKIQGLMTRAITLRSLAEKIRLL